MTVPQPGSVAEGTVYSVIKVPSPWPVAQPMILVSIRLSDGILSVRAEPTGQIRAAVVDANGSTHEVLTCPIISESSPNVIFSVLWKLPELIVEINGTTVGTTEPEHQRSEPFSCPPNRPFDPSQGDDLAVLNLDKLNRRRSRLAGWQPLPKRIQGDAEHVFAALNDEVLQLKDLIALIGAGSIHHAPGLASRLRMLIADGDPLPLLQQCAAMMNAPLMAFTTSRIGTRVPVRPAFNIKFDISSAPSGSLQNPIDLDLWLDQPGAEIGDEALSHGQLLKQVGNTIGAHFDKDMRPSVFFLRSLRTEMGKVPMDMVLNYLRTVAMVAIALAEEVLQARQ